MSRDQNMPRQREDEKELGPGCDNAILPQDMVENIFPIY